MSTHTLHRLEKIIGAGLIVLVAVMPFHAFLSVWLDSLIHHGTIIQAWKEVLLVILGLLTVVLLACEPSRLHRLRQSWVIAGGAFMLIALLVTLVTQPSFKAAAFGVKTDLEFIGAAIIALLVGSTQLVRRLEKVVLAGAGLVIGFGLMQIFVLPPNFLTHFGYGTDTILPYQHLGASIDGLRFASTLGGPNQLGTYLILPMCLGLSMAIRTRRWWLLLLPAAASIVLINTYSRGAWIGAIVALALTAFALIPRRMRLALTLLGGGLVIVGSTAAFLALRHSDGIDQYILHSTVGSHNLSSDEEHALSLRTGTQSVTSQPLGHGLGTAGPAVFHTGNGNIIENYFLQIGYETGVLGALIFLTLIALLTYTLWRHAPPIAATIIGVSVVGLVLPAWTDSSTSLIVWTLAGAAAFGRIDATNRRVR